MILVWKLQKIYNYFYKIKFMFIIHILSAIGIFPKTVPKKIDCSASVPPTWPPSNNFFPNDIFNVKRPQLSKNKTVGPVTPGS